MCLIALQGCTKRCLRLRRKHESPFGPKRAPAGAREALRALEGGVGALDSDGYRIHEALGLEAHVLFGVCWRLEAAQKCLFLQLGSPRFRRVFHVMGEAQRSLHSLADQDICKRQTETERERERTRESEREEESCYIPCVGGGKPLPIEAFAT